jgi:Rne/Rng family ribonuclease
MKKEMLINVLQPEECRIAIVEDGTLEELYVERTSHESYVGNIYKGRIVNIEPSIQAAFVDFGVGRNGFLHVSDVEPAYYRHLEPRRSDQGNRRGPNGRDRPRAATRAVEEEADPGDSELEATLEEAEAITGTPAPLPPEPPPEGEPNKRGRRSRGRSRSRRREEAAGAALAVGREPCAPATEAAEPRADKGAALPRVLALPEAEAPPEHDQPPYMDSAEHRTQEDPATTEAVEAPSAPVPAEDFHPPPEPVPARSEAAGREPEAAMWQEPPPEPAAPLHQPGLMETGFDEGEDSETQVEQRFQDFDEDLEEVRPRRRQGRDDRRGRRNHRRAPGRLGAGRPKPLIQDIFRRGQEVLVQVIKEGIGTKGPTLSTYISIAGRYLVLMPGLNRIGVSRKIADEEQRRRLREILSELKPPKGLGFIIRTAGMDKNKKELQRDLAYLSRLWQVVVRRIRKLKAPAEIYQESDMITRTIRDTFTSEIDTIWVDEHAAFEHAQEFLQIVMPRYANRIREYTDPAPLFHKYGIEEEIARIQQRHVPLPNGGSIVIDQTEALVAIDVNSGNFRADNNAEETAYQMNLLASKEIARQLRLRDLGGVIVNDFIDMREDKHRRGVERALREAVKRDRARTKILKISAFGIIEMTRQRIRPSLKRSVYQDCPHCAGTGQVKTCESMSIDVMRMMQLAAHRANIHRIQIRVAEDVASYLLNKKRKEIARLEEIGDIQVYVTGVAGASLELLEFVCFDNNNNEIKFPSYEESKPRPRLT